MTKIAFIGAGSVVFTQNLLTDIYQYPEFKDATIALMDIDPVRLQAAGKMARTIQKRAAASGRIEEHLDRRRALENADFVLNMVQVGMHEATLLDFEIPKKYGLRQTIADTLGIGGIFRFLRTAPVVESLCRDIEEVAADALLLNYTNPMAMLMLLIFRESRVRAVGLCHSIQNTAEQLESYMQLEKGTLHYHAAGINHMAWFLQLRYRGEDAYPRLRTAMEDDAIRARDPVRFEIFRRFGYFVSESSEHMAEYVPYFIQFPEEVQRLRIPLDEYIRRSEANLKTFDTVRRKLDRGEPFDLRPSNEYAAAIMHAVTEDEPCVIYGNVENTGLITNLPQGCCVEVPYLVDRNGIQPTAVGALPPQLAALNRTNVNVQELAVAAYTERSREHVYHAALLDPNTTGQLSTDAIGAMVDELFEAHRDRLPDFFFD